MTLSQRLRTYAKHTGLDSVIKLLQEAADEIDRLSASAALPTLRPGYSHMESLIESAIQGHASTRDAMRWLVHQLVPHPSMATQAEVTDEQILEIAEPFGEFQYGDAQGHKRIDFARAILALRPERVPMTEGIRPEDFTVDVVVKPMGGFAPVNTQGVRVTHKPTGISVTCDAARSQHTNRHQAFEKLRAILALRHERVPMTHKQAIEMNDAAFDKYVTQDARAIELVRSVEAHHRIQAKKEQA